MIPVELYRSKLEDLENVLQKMGKDPQSVSDWFLEGIAKGQIDMAAIGKAGMQSLKLVQSLPQTTMQSILGIKLTEPRGESIVQEIQSLNEETVNRDLSDIGGIESLLRRLAVNVTNRMYAVRRRVLQIEDQAMHDLDRSHELAMVANELTAVVIPILMRLREEIMAGIDQCARETKVRVDQLHFILWRSSWSPKFSKKVWRKRMARLKRRQKAEEEERKRREAEQKKEEEDSGAPSE